jgi:hypothetical protein
MAKMTVPFARGLQFGCAVRAECKPPDEMVKFDLNPLSEYFDNYKGVGDGKR